MATQSHTLASALSHLMAARSAEKVLIALRPLYDIKAKGIHLIRQEGQKGQTLTSVLRGVFREAMNPKFVSLSDLRDAPDNREAAESVLRSFGLIKMQVFSDSANRISRIKEVDGENVTAIVLEELIMPIQRKLLKTHAFLTRYPHPNLQSANLDGAILDAIRHVVMLCIEFGCEANEKGIMECMQLIDCFQDSLPIGRSLEEPAWIVLTF